MTTLLLSARSTEDNQALWRAAIRSGWNVERVRGLTVPDGLSNEEVVLYVEALFAPEIAKELSLKLIGPEEDWLVKLPFEYRKRDVRIAALGEARKLNEPAFVKPPNDKLFTAKMFESGYHLVANLSKVVGTSLSATTFPRGHLLPRCRAAAG